MQSGLQSPDLDTTGTQRQLGALEQVTQAEFQSIRALGGSADATFTFGPRGSLPASGAQGDRYYATDIGARGGYLYYYTGTVWELLTGWASGTDAQRSAYAPDTTDDGGYFWTTDTGKVWEVSSGAWVDRFVDIAVATGFKVGANYVVKARGTAVADVASADAIDLATVITLANENKAQLNALLARVRAATGHGLIA